MKDERRKFPNWSVMGTGLQIGEYSAVMGGTDFGERVCEGTLDSVLLCN